MEIANTVDIRVIVHYNVVNGGDKQGHAQASTVIYKMKDEEATAALYDYIRNMGGDQFLVHIDAYRKQRGEWRNVLDTVNIDNVTYIEWPKDVIDKFTDADSTE